jgi:hypothetical protein
MLKLKPLDNQTAVPRPRDGNISQQPTRAGPPRAQRYGIPPDHGPTSRPLGNVARVRDQLAGWAAWPILDAAGEGCEQVELIAQARVV